VCPLCHGPLEDREAAVGCRACGRAFPRLGGGIDFLGEVTDDHKLTQRAIYEGDREANVSLSYRDREEYRAQIEQLHRHAAATGIAFDTMKDAMNGVMFEKIGLTRGMEVLDVGAGSGHLLNLIGCRYGARGTGVDISALALRRVLEFNPLELRFLLADAERLPFAGGSFDRVISFDVLEHLPNQRAALTEAARVVRPGGRLLFYAISAADEHTWHWTQRAASGGRYGRDDAAGHVRELFLDPHETAVWLRDAGFDEVETTPFHAFFTLLIDERLQRALQVFTRNRRLYRALFAAARAADAVWTAAGLGNGFYLSGTKRGG
jgi:ubiquinone/menaquinone biosynthesis C-methylase UbiE